MVKVKQVAQLVRRILLKINEFNQRQWFIFSLISTTSGIWFSLILKFWGEELKLISYQGDKMELTKLGLVLTLVTVMWSFLSISAQRYNDYHNSNLGISVDMVSKTETIYETIEKSIYDINEENVSRKILYVDKLLREHKPFPQIYSSPCLELQRINSEIRKVLSKLLTTRQHNLKEEDMVVNIYYCFCNLDNEWHRADSSRPEKGLTISRLLNEESTFSECLKAEDNYAYHHSKKEAYENHCYIPDETDGTPGTPYYMNGSILCRKFSVINKGKEFINCVVAISTYKKKFSKQEDEITKNNISYNIKNNILNEYEALIKDALCDLYIYEQNKIDSVAVENTQNDG